MSNEWLQAEVANLASRVKDTERLLLASVRERTEAAKIITLDPSKVTRAMYDALVKRQEEQAAQLAAYSAALKSTVESLKFLTGVVEGIADEISSTPID